MWDTTFQNVFTKVQMRELLQLGTRWEAPEGEVIAQAGQPSRRTLLLLSHGAINVRDPKGNERCKVGPGEFVNEFRYVRGRDDDPEPVTTTFSAPSFAIRWELK